MANLLSAAVAAKPRPEANASDLTLTLLGPSAAMAQLWGQVRRLAPHVRTLLLTGEANCGQQAVARLLLDLSPQHDRTFIALTAAEVESRLLHSPGFSSLPTEILLFVPDVHRLTVAGQRAVLRLLRQRRARAFTLVAAAAEDLASLVSLGRFCPELAECLGAISIAVPALHDRTQDLPILIHHLLSTLSAAGHHALPIVSESFLLAAMEYRWAGNLSELTRTLAWLCADGKQDPLEPADLFRALAALNAPTTPERSPARLVSLDTIVQEHIGFVLRACRGNKLRAAEVLGISRSTLYRMLDTQATGGSLATAIDPTAVIR